ncbi:MAG: tRNA preQ1(34) S-adenosylmethionine ribosyltransferase-isomerase QueA [Thermoplasmata archaeon]|nr:MAG: tRNA preQ1(34) S-adenosylmethionine ribosyltransferase-isomerase QueA [Thermoplasmata archaeon]
MHLSDFDYQLPTHLIAQRPAEPRDSSRLMVMQRDIIEHKKFRDLKDYLDRGDILILNDSKVLPARIFGKKVTGGKVEVLLVTKEDESTWECLIKGKNIKENTRLFFGDNELVGKIMERIEGGRYRIEFEAQKDLGEILKRIGKMPTPPYIKELLLDQDRYQTVYGKENGSIAAPTAGLHFTEDFLAQLREKGVVITPLTLHVSVGTFLPVKVKYIREHKMEPELFEIDNKTAKTINSAREDKKKIIAVGTTTLKALESACDDNGRISETKGESDLFIYPGYEFKFKLDGLLTNFHLPKSTLIMLVSAFAGKDTILDSYNVAIEHSYRFYSFGDAMLILK